MTFKLRSSGPFKMMGSSPTKHYTGSHKGAKDHPAHKLEDLSLSNVVKRTKKNVGKLYDSLTGKPKAGKGGKGGKGSAGAAGQSMVPPKGAKKATRYTPDMVGVMKTEKGVVKPKKGKFLKTKVEKELKMNKKASKRTNLKSTQDKLNENIQKGVKTKYSN